MTSWHSDILAFNFQLSGIFEEVEITVHSGNSFAARPDLTKQFDENVSNKNLAAFFDVPIKSNFLVNQLLASCWGNINVVVLICQASMCYSFEPVADQLILDLWSLHHTRNVIQVSKLTRLVNSVGLFIESFGVVKLQAFLGWLEETYEQHEGDYRGSCPPFSMVAVYSDYLIFGDYIG